MSAGFWVSVILIGDERNIPVFVVVPVDPLDVVVLPELVDPEDVIPGEVAPEEVVVPLLEVVPLLVDHELVIPLQVVGFHFHFVIPLVLAAARIVSSSSVLLLDDHPPLLTTGAELNVIFSSGIRLGVGMILVQKLDLRAIVSRTLASTSLNETFTPLARDSMSIFRVSREISL
jgi:hypothetical protein